MSVEKVVVNTMKCSSGDDYFVELVNDKNETHSIFVFKIVGHANYTVKEYADFIGVPYSFAKVKTNVCETCNGTGTDEDVSVMGCGPCNNTGKKLEE